MAVVLPSPLSPIVDSQGRPTREFYEWLQFRDRMKLGDLRDINVTGAVNGDQLTYDDADGKWKPDAA